MDSEEDKKMERSHDSWYHLCEQKVQDFSVIWIDPLMEEGNDNEEEDPVAIIVL